MSSRVRALVTGGAGFLGSHLCLRLLQEGMEVICLDNLYTGNFANISALNDDPNFSFVNHDVNQPIDLAVDVIFNLASPASPIKYQLDPVFTTTTNVLGAINVLDLARRLKTPILQTSTSEVYGDPEQHPQTESYWGRVNPIGIRACYDEGKRCAETLFFDYFRQYNVDIKVLRLFNTYGPNMAADDGRVVSNFITQALKGECLTIYGDGNQTRSFCYVADMIDVIYAAMFSNVSGPGPFNVGNPQEVCMLDIAKKVIELTGSKSQIEFRQLPADDPVKRRPDISKAVDTFGWKPKYSLDQGLKMTIPYFEKLTS